MCQKTNLVFQDLLKKTWQEKLNIKDIHDFNKKLAK